MDTQHYTAITVPEDLDVATASQLMRDRQVRFLVVTDPCAPGAHGIVGIVSGQDIARSASADDVESSALTVGDVMTRPALILRADQPVGTLSSLMNEAGAQCAPMLAANGELVGVLSATA